MRLRSGVIAPPFRAGGYLRGEDGAIDQPGPERQRGAKIAMLFLSADRRIEFNPRLQRTGSAGR